MTETTDKEALESDDDRCTTCDDTGITIQTERPCACAAGDQYRVKQAFDVSRNVTDEEIEQWAATRADDAGYLARRLITMADKEELKPRQFCVGKADGADIEEGLRLAEIGEYLYNKAYSYGDGRTEPREYGIEWQWQQTKPNEFGQGVLLAEAVKWHNEMAEDGYLTEAAKLRAIAASALTNEAAREIERLRAALINARKEGRSEGLEEAAKMVDSLFLEFRRGGLSYSKRLAKETAAAIRAKIEERNP